MMMSKRRNNIKKCIIVTLSIGILCYFYPSKIDGYIDGSTLIKNVTKISIEQSLQYEHTYTDLIVTDSIKIRDIINDLRRCRIRRIIPNISGWYTVNREDYRIEFYGDDNRYYGEVKTIGDQYINIDDFKAKIIETDGVIHPYKVINKIDLNYIKDLFDE